MLGGLLDRGVAGWREGGGAGAEGGRGAGGRNRGWSRGVRAGRLVSRSSTC